MLCFPQTEKQNRTILPWKWKTVLHSLVTTENSVWTTLGETAITIVNKGYIELQDLKDGFEGLAKFFPTQNKINNISSLNEDNMGGKR